jgi:hypothetical protein
MTMTKLSLSPTRRGFLATSATALVATSLTASSFNLHSATVASAAEDSSIRPLHVNVPQADLDDLRRRVLATRWPAKETVNDQSQGVQRAKLQELVKY